RGSRRGRGFRRRRPARAGKPGAVYPATRRPRTPVAGGRGRAARPRSGLDRARTHARSRAPRPNLDRGAGRMIGRPSSIDFDGVSITYAGTTAPALRDVNLHIGEGELAL